MNAFALRLEGAQDELFTKEEAESVAEWLNVRSSEGTVFLPPVLDAKHEQVHGLPYDVESFEYDQALGGWDSQVLSKHPEWHLPFDAALDRRGNGND